MTALRTILMIAFACGVPALSAGAQEAQYYVLDAFGGVHAGNGAPSIAPATPYFGFDVAADVEYFQPQGAHAAGLLVLDKFGGVHPGGGLTAEPNNPPTPYFGFDAARAIVARDTKPRIMAVSVSSGGSSNGAIDVESVSRIGTGHYLIDFERSVFLCTWSVTLGRESGFQLAAHAPIPGEVSASASTGGTLRVSTMDSDGDLADRSFHVIVACRGS